MSTATDFIAANQGPPAKPDVSVFDVINAVQQKHSVDDIENVRLQSQKNGLNSSKFSHSDALRLAVMYGHYAYGDFLLKHHLVESFITQRLLPPVDNSCETGSAADNRTIVSV